MSSASYRGFEKIVIVTRKTRLQDLREKFNTTEQAKFYVAQQVENFQALKKAASPTAAKERAAQAIEDYVEEEGAYEDAVDTLGDRLRAFGLHVQYIDRALVPTYLFTEHDIVMTLGQDGLVANCAKYAKAQPIIGVNPDPEHFDGILLPFVPENAPAAVEAVLRGHARIREVTMAEAELNDGQRLLAFNDLFIGPQTHVSARYRIEFDGRSEQQSSSGVLVSTGAGSTGWLSSVFNMAAGLSGFSGGQPGARPKLEWEDRRLVFAVREPFASRASEASLVAGEVEEGRELELESLMPAGGVIFSDGMESDFLAFNSGTVATIRPAAQRARLVAA